MQGLRTQESEKFNRFWDIVQDTAARQDKVFFADCGEGRELKTKELEGENFCGWLIPQDQVSGFEPDWQKCSVSDGWIDNMVWMEWELTVQGVQITFEEL